MFAEDDVRVGHCRQRGEKGAGPGREHAAKRPGSPGVFGPGLGKPGNCPLEASGAEQGALWEDEHSVIWPETGGEGAYPITSRNGLRRTSRRAKAT